MPATRLAPASIASHGRRVSSVEGSDCSSPRSSWSFAAVATDATATVGPVLKGSEGVSSTLAERGPSKLEQFPLRLVWQLELEWH